MCDYSLEHYQSRPARKGERYETRRFPSGSIGFVQPENNSVPVCMACDMRLNLESLPMMLRTRYEFAAIESVVFTQIDSQAYRDAVQFENGALLTLQELGPGVSATLIDDLSAALPADQPAETLSEARA